MKSPFAILISHSKAILHWILTKSIYLVNHICILALCIIILLIILFITGYLTRFTYRKREIADDKVFDFEKAT